jgi:hypothetical protein
VLPSDPVPAKAKTTCCRTMPRCAGCPVVLAARARMQQQRAGARAALVEEMLVGRPPRALPEPVQAALQQLVAARS